jgi:colanic acid biosynthesis glycosyl transferase WcaI
MERSRLESRIAEEHLDNVRLLPLQPRDEYFNIISSSDLSIVSLDSRMRAPCIPGKMINLLATSQPILAMVSQDSETSRFVKEARCGFIVEPRDIESMRQKILELKDNDALKKELGRNGRNYLEKYMRIELVCAQYEKIFENLVHCTNYTI